MKIKWIDHIGVAVKDIKQASRFYGLLGLEVSKEYGLPSQKIKIAYINTPATKIELIQSTSEDSIISKFIEKRGEGIHHLCFVVEDIERSLAELKSKGVELIDVKPRLNPHNEKIAFINPKSANGVLIELKEK
ncbi:MAG: methylmalonyl-CoA epimerase [candidate division Zixibacteria bacterium]|nr:methylmalonyl-CoA epimerase [candidate division Zixibacteria bacterium]